MKNFLLPYTWKFVGLLLTLGGIVMAGLYTWLDVRIMLPVFAVYSSFLETKIFTSFRTNVSDEITLLLLIAGLGLIVLSREKNESETTDLLRLKAFIRSVEANIILLLLSVLFVFGTGFVYAMVFNLVSFLVFYLVFFYFFKRQFLNNSGS
jgi:hypothetical protein